MLLLKRWIVEFLGSLQERACRRRRRRLGLCGEMVLRFCEEEEEGEEKGGGEEEEAREEEGEEKGGGEEEEAEAECGERALEFPAEASGERCGESSWVRDGRGWCKQAVQAQPVRHA